MKPRHVIYTLPSACLLVLSMYAQVFPQSMNQVATYTDITFYDSTDVVEGEVDLTESYVLYSHTYSISSTMYSPGYTRSNWLPGSHSSAPSWHYNGLDLLTEDGTYRFDTSIEQWCDYAQQYSSIGGGTITQTQQPFVKLSLIGLYQENGTTAYISTDTLSGLTEKATLRLHVTLAKSCVDTSNHCGAAVQVNLIPTTGTPALTLSAFPNEPGPNSQTTPTFSAPWGGGVSQIFKFHITNTNNSSDGTMKFEGVITADPSSVRVDGPSSVSVFLPVETP